MIITAGVARKPGMTREDLVHINAGIVTDVVQRGRRALARTAILIMMTNPLDTMTYLAHKVSGFPRERVIGQAGVLDGGRMRTFIAMETGISPENIHTTVLGGHGDEMVPLVRYSTIAGMPLTYFLSQEQIDHIVARTRDGGAEIVRYLKTGSAYYAPGASACKMAQAIIRDQHHIYPASVYLQGEYGLERHLLRRAGHPGQERRRADHPDRSERRREGHDAEVGRLDSQHDGAPAAAGKLDKKPVAACKSVGAPRSLLSRLNVEQQEVVSVAYEVKNQKLKAWVDEVAALCQPEAVLLV